MIVLVELIVQYNLLDGILKDVFYRWLIERGDYEGNAAFRIEERLYNDVEELESVTAHLPDVKVKDGEDGQILVYVEGLDPLEVHPQVDTKLGPIG